MLKEVTAKKCQLSPDGRTPPRESDISALKEVTTKSISYRRMDDISTSALKEVTAKKHQLSPYGRTLSVESDISVC